MRETINHRNSNLLLFQNISKLFGQTAALRALDLECTAGRTTVLIGPSGCGKSTILRLVVGLIQPDTGVISLAGEPLSPANLGRARQRIGYVIQEGGLFPHLTAAQNIAVMSRYLRWEKARIEARVADLARLVQLPEYLLARFPAQLSGGERQRVGLMRALMLDPDLLLLDEPLGALDPMIRYELQQDLKRIFAELRKTVVLVTHDLGEAGFLGDHIVLLRDGCIAQQGSAGALLSHPADHFVEQFINAQRAPFSAWAAGPP